MKWRLLDLCCGAGGAAKGYAQAGFEVTGVDINPQPRFPYKFVQFEALTYLRELIQSGEINQYHAVHASFPCQRFSKSVRVEKKKNLPDLITPGRYLLQKTGLPYVLENVPGSPLIDPLRLNGPTVGLPLIERERLFETSFFILSPSRVSLPENQFAPQGYTPKEGQRITVCGHFGGVDYAKKAMGIDWMGQKELAQAIPPAYTEYVGRFLLKHLEYTHEKCN